MGTLEQIARERIEYALADPTARPTMMHSWWPQGSYPHLVLACWSEDGATVHLSISRSDTTLGKVEIDTFLKAFAFPGGELRAVRQTIGGREWSTIRVAWTPAPAAPPRIVRRSPRKVTIPLDPELMEDLL